MSSLDVVCEAADLSLLAGHQPADTVLRWVPFNLWAVFVRHGTTLASDAQHRGDFITPILIDLGVGDHLLSPHLTTNSLKIILELGLIASPLSNLRKSSIGIVVDTPSQPH